MLNVAAVLSLEENLKTRSLMSENNKKKKTRHGSNKENILKESKSECIEESHKKPSRAQTTTLCPHGIERVKCRKEGCFNRICMHGKWKKNCRICGTGFCEHQRRKNRCSLCGTGTSLCEHKREKSKCRQCGTGICIEHVC